MDGGAGSRRLASLAWPTHAHLTNGFRTTCNGLVARKPASGTGTRSGLGSDSTERLASAVNDAVRPAVGFTLLGAGVAGEALDGAGGVGVEFDGAALPGWANGLTIVCGPPSLAAGMNKPGG
jgi:hypothetical protein